MELIEEGLMHAELADAPLAVGAGPFGARMVATVPVGG